jgi:YidC/Oxa1 family membrane protein insertase
VSILNPLFDAVAWVMMQIHAGLAHLFGASSGATWALSIVLLVVLMRLVMVPLFIKQRNSMQKMQSHTPQLQEIRKKFKHDKTRLNEETMKFYKENGINPLGGCLPLIAQLPVFWSLFNVLKAIAQWAPAAKGQVQSQPKYGMTIQFVESAHKARIFGISLYDQFLHPAAGETLTSRLLIVVFVLVSAATTFMTMKQSQKRGMMNQGAAPDPDQPGAAAAASMSKNMMYIAPFFALTGLYWQFGLVLYWVTTNVWTLGQQHFLFRKLPVVGSATVGASATDAASGPTGAATRTPSAKTAAGRTPAARSAAARNGSASAAAKARSGAPAKAGSGTAATPAAGAAKAASGAAAKAGSGAPVKAAAATDEAKTSGAKAPAAKPATAKAPAKAGASGSATAAAPAAKAAAPAAKAAAPAPKAKANGNGAVSNGAGNGSSNGSTVRRLLGRSKEEPQEVPAAPQTKTVRQQPVRQTRSGKRGNTGKR